MTEPTQPQPQQLVIAAQQVHSQLEEIPAMIARFREQKRAPHYSEFAEQLYLKAKELLEMEAERLDRLLQGLTESVPTESELTISEYIQLLTVLSDLDTLRMPLNEETLREAIDNNNLSLLLFQLHEHEGHPQSDTIFDYALQHQKSNAARMILRFSSRFRISESALTTATAYGLTAVVKDLLHNTHVVINPDLLPTPIMVACDRGHTEIVRILLNDGRIDPAAQNNFAIINSNKKSIAQLLLQDPRVDPTADNNSAIRLACENGHTEIVRLLLQDPRVDPTANINDAFRYASQNGHTEVVRLLLQDPRVDPSVEDNFAIRTACRFAHTEVVRLLLQDPRVDPTATNNIAIRTACFEGHTEVVRLLLADPRVDPTAKNNEAIRTASANGHAEVVRLLLAWSSSSGTKCVDPATNDNSAIDYACRNGHAEIVRLLLQDPRVDPTAYNNQPIQLASLYGHVEVVRLLLTDPRVDPSADDNLAIRWAKENGNTEVVQLLKQDPRVGPSA